MALIALPVAKAAAAGFSSFRSLAKVGQLVDRACNCFVGGTLIATSMGAVPIELIRPGDLVYACSEWDPEGSEMLYPVIDCYVDTATSATRVSLASGDIISATAEHPVWVMDAGWVSLGALVPGDRLRTRDGLGTEVVSVEHDCTTRSVYNLNVSGAHTYFAENVLVHNSSCSVADRAVRGVTRNYFYRFGSEREDRQLARQMVGHSATCVAPNKMRSLDGKWQYRAKAGDVGARHVHIEELDPITGLVKNNYHLSW